MLICLSLLSYEITAEQGLIIGGAQGAGRASALVGTLVGGSLDASDREKLDPETKKRYETGYPLTMSDVIKMNNAGIDPDKIIGAIEGNRCYPLTSDDVKKMEEAGVSPRIIKAMNENYIQ